MEIKKLFKKDFPKLLQEISSLPPHLYYKGTLPPCDYKYLCIVGSRNNSDYGKNSVRKLISGLKGYPIVIVSGLAYGIDSLSHEYALNNGLITISFPGSGLDEDVLYPQSKKYLAKRIVENGGALFSPFESNKLSTNWTFPYRNRLMAGISHATLIVEANKGSGTLITADFAIDFNRDVLAIPGDIDRNLSYGPHMLIKRGAALISSSQDILEILGFSPRQEERTDFAKLDLNQYERAIMESLSIQPMSSTDLIEKTKLPSQLFNVIISELELRGLVLGQEGIYKIA